jgi:hypothetical protein
MRFLILLLLTSSYSVHGQAFSPNLVAMFDAVTVDQSRLYLTEDQYSAIRTITKLARNGKEQRALARWKKFVEMTYVDSGNLDYDGIARVIVKDAYFEFDDVKRIAGRYVFYKKVRLDLLSLENEVDNFRSYANPDDIGYLTDLESKIDYLLAQLMHTSSDNEMTMFKLQAAMQQRSQVVQSGSNMLASIYEAS